MKECTLPKVPAISILLRVISRPWREPARFWFRLAAIFIFLIFPATAGLSQDAGEAQAAATNLWELKFSQSVSDSSPALAPDGTIYQASFTGNFFAVSARGQIEWTFKAGREIESSPAVAPDGTIYFGSRDRKFYALAPDGKLKWTFATGAWNDSSPAIAAEGTIYFGSWDTNFYALNSDGSLKWKFPTDGIIDSSPAIGADGTVYFGSHDKNFYALAPDGKLRWKFLTQGPIVSSPAIASDGTIYFSSTDGNLYALKPDGGVLWKLRTGGFTESSPVLDAQGEICIGVNESVIGVSAAGKQIWRHGLAVLTDSSVAAAANGLVYFSLPWRHLGAFTQNGKQFWYSNLKENVSSSPVIGDGGVIYVTAGRFLNAISPTNGAPLAKSSWPMFRANPQHTGRIETR